MPAICVIAVGLASCGGQGSGGSSTVAESGVTLTRISDPSGPPKVRLPPGPPPQHLVVKDIRPGSGVAIPRKGGVKIRTNFVAVSYRTGKPYEVRWSKHGSFNIGFGPGIEIKGWEKGLPGMRVGGRRELLVPSKLAYGEGALLYVIDLLGIEKSR